ncbi:MAG: hypothetical protein K2W92_04190 [Alphaproteobacteria bacterium]|nr:hypothetical protein [Alphaproteobacteria bacterium]
MKTKPIFQSSFHQRHFFLFMIVPVLIGIAITATSLAHAEWYKDDPCLQSPKNQGWKQFEEPTASSSAAAHFQKRLPNHS